MAGTVTSDDGATVAACERWLTARGTPHLIENYNATEDVFTRALPLFTIVFLLELSVALSSEEIAARLAQWTPKPARYKDGVFAKYAKLVSSAALGAVIDAIRLAYCQDTVIGILLFHVFDEIDLRGWQSGTRYVDDTPKASYEPVKRTAEAARRGDVDCDAEG